MSISLVDVRSLGQTLCNISTAQILGHPVSAQQKRQAAAFIISRQGLPGSYAGMFALTDEDRAIGRFPLATGEKPDTRASMAHIAGEEACRALLTLGVQSQAITNALNHATHNFLDYLSQYQIEKPDDGYFCCGKCSVAMWRNLAAGGLRISGISTRKRLVNGLEHLKSCRQDNGRWRAFPFFYTLLALTELPRNIAREELAYIAPVCKRLLKRSAKADTTDQVRRVIMSRALAAA